MHPKYILIYINICQFFGFYVTEQTSKFVTNNSVLIFYWLPKSNNRNSCYCSSYYYLVHRNLLIHVRIKLCHELHVRCLSRKKRAHYFRKIKYLSLDLSLAVTTSSALNRSLYKLHFFNI